MKTFAQNLARKCNTTTRRRPRELKRNQKLICMTSSSKRREQTWVVLGDYARYLKQIFLELKKFTDNHHGGTCQNSRWRSPYWISKMP